MSIGAIVQQARNVVVRGCLDQVAGSPDLQEASILEHRDPVAEAKRLINVMRDHDHGLVETLLEIEKVPLQLVTCHRVQRAKRLVEQNDFGVGREGSGKGHALSLSAGQFHGIAGPEPSRVKIHELEEHIHPARSSLRRPSKEERHEANVVFDGPVR